MIKKWYGRIKALLDKTFLGKFINRETIAYALTGVLTTLWDIGVFQLLYFFGMDYRLSNLLAMVTTKLLAYLANKFVVFRTHCETKLDLLKEIGSYIAARSFTLVFEFFGLILWSDVLHLDPGVGKWVVTLLVVILNYILGKTLVFIYGKKNDGADDAAEDN